MSRIERILLITVLLITSVFSASAENPPFANPVNGPIVAGANYDFTVRLDPAMTPDCGQFFFDCNVDGAYLENVDVYWGIYAISDCATCDLGGTLVTSGVINHGVWGTTCIVGNTDPGTDCTNAGGCDNIFSVPITTFCPSTTYELRTYAINADYTKGLADGSDSAAGPYRCCANNPGVGGIAGMADCSLTGGGSGWFNPSFPQVYTFTTPDAPPAPPVSLTTSVADGEIVNCGHFFTSEFSFETPTCFQSNVEYTIYVNDEPVRTGTGDCDNLPSVSDLTGAFLSCPSNPDCIPGPGQIKVNCGANTIRWEAVQLCTDGLVSTEEMTVIIACPELGDLTTVGPSILCEGEQITVEVVDESEINNPYPGGSYELHFNNSNPYDAPEVNYLGTGFSATLTNDGTYPTNIDIVAVGTIWENFDSDGGGCDVFAEAPAFVMLEAISLDFDLEPCNFNSINVSASGGLPGYDATENYTYDASDAGAGSNTTGIFNSLAGGGPIPAGIYDIVVSDDEGCTATIEVPVYNEITVNDTPPACDETGSISLTVGGGQPASAGVNDLTNFTVESDIDGFLGNVSASGDFSLSSGVSAGAHSLTIGYEHLNGDGSASGVSCVEIITYEVYDDFAITLSDDICDFQNAVTITDVTGGSDPNNTVGGGFVGASYTIFLSTNPAPGATNDVTSTPSTLSDAGAFSGVATGDYHVVVEDDRGCQFSVPVSMYQDDLTIADITANCSNNTISIQTTGSGDGEWTYYLFEQGVPFSPTGPQQSSPVTPTEVSANTFEGTFNFIASNEFTVYAEYSEGCGVIGIDVNVFNELSLTQISACGDNDITVEASGGYAGASFNSADYTYTLFDGTTPISNNTTGTFSGFPPSDDYSVEVSDGNPDAAALCSTSINVGSTEPLSISATGVDGTCDIPGSVNITAVAGGNIPYTIYISTTAAPSASNDVATIEGSLSATGTLTGVPAGSFFAVVEDDAGCQASVPVTIANSVVEATVNVSLDCDATSGVVQATVTGGGTPDWDFYIYQQGSSFDPSNPTSGSGFVASDLGNGSGTDTQGDFTGIAAGNYSIYAISDEGCSASPANTSIGAPITITAEAGGGCASGGVTVTAVSGGSPAYSIFLSTTAAPGATNNVSSTPATLASTGSFADVAIGNYFVVVEDNAGCQASTPVTVTDDVSVIELTDESDCSTAAGAIAVLAPSGTGPWSFYLFQSGSTFNESNPTGGAGFIGADVGSGTADFAGNFSGIATGDYTVYGIDAEGCVSEGLNVSSSPALILSAEAAGTCANPEVAITAVSGGDGDYTIFLSSSAAPGATNNVTSSPNTLSGTGSFSGITTASFFVVVEDGNGCQVSTPIELSLDPPQLTLEGGDCASSSNQVVVSASDGTPGFDFYLYTSTGSFDPANPTNGANGFISSDLSSGSTDVQGIFNSVTAGTYQVFAIDAANCDAGPVDVTVVDPIVLQASGSCENASVEITAVSGGAAPYTIFLSSSAAPGASNNISSSPNTLNGLGTFTNVPNGNFFAVVEDDNGCQVSVAVAVGEPIDLSQGEDDNCSGGGLLSVEAGSADWTFYLYETSGSFDPSNPTNTGNGYLQTTLGNNSGVGSFSGLTPGNYAVYGVDPNGCPSNPLAATVVDADPIVLTNNTELCDYGEVHIGASGGTPGYSFTLLTALGLNAGSSTTGDFTGVNPGNYSVEVEDSNGCTKTIEGIQVVADAITLAEPYNCVAGFEVTGGVGNYIYELYTATFSPTLVAENTTGVFDEVPDEDYLLYVTDENGCQFSTLITCNSECDLQGNTSTACVDEDGYNVLLTFFGSSSYTIEDGVHPTLTGQSAGFQLVGPFPNGNYSITITDELNPGCSTVLTGEDDCSLCELEISATVDCTSDTTYDLDIVITGPNTYTVSTSAGNTTTTGAGSFSFTGLDASTDITLTATDTEDAECSKTIDIEPVCDECDLEASVTTACNDSNTAYNATVTISGSNTYTVSDGVNPTLTNQPAGVVTLGPLESGNYSITVTDSDDPTCTTTLTGSETCLACDLEVSYTATCINALTFGLELTIEGSDLYSVSNGVNTLPSVPDGTFSFGNYQSGSDVVISVSSQSDPECSQVLNISEECDCDLELSYETNCTGAGLYDLDFTIAGSGTFDVFNGTTTAQLTAGTYQLTNLDAENNLTLTVTNTENDNCSESATVVPDCPTCDLEFSYEVECQEGSTYDILLTVGGTGSYELSNGTTSTTVPAGTYPVLGLDAFGPALTFSATDVTDPTCTVSLPITQDCRECDLEVSFETDCLDAETFDAFITLTASGGTYVISNGITTIENVPPGTYEMGTYLVEGGAAFTISSADDGGCFEILQIQEECFVCDLQFGAVTECVDDFNFNVIVGLTSGNGTYTIDDGINPPLTGQETGQTLTIGPIPNGPYNVTVTSEFNPDCTQSAAGNEFCYSCNVTAFTAIECSEDDLDNFSVLINLSGAGTYTISDGVNPTLTGQSSGGILVGPLPNGDHSITIISEIDPNCIQQVDVTGDCFDCNLNVGSTIQCSDNNTYTVLMNFTGQGPYTVTEQGQPGIPGQLSGTYSFGPYASGEPYSVSIVSEVDPICQEVIGGTEFCFDCDLPISSTPICISEEGYQVSFNITGSGSYTINDGQNPIQTGVTAGVYTSDPIPSGAYAIVITSELDPTCTTTLAGNSNCFECDLAISAATDCTGEESYSLFLTITGSGSYSVSGDNIESLSGVQAGLYQFDQVPNGPYNFVVSSEVDPNCSLNIGGTEDCIEPFECDLTVTAEPICSEEFGEDGFLVIVQISSSGQYNVESGTGNSFTGGGTSTYTVGPFENGEYNIVVTSTEDPECTASVSGTFSCDQPHICDPAATAVTNCINLAEYEIIISLTGSSSYSITIDPNLVTIDDEIYLPAQIAGEIVISNIPNGVTGIYIEDDLDPNCVLELQVEDDCFFDCDLNVASSLECTEDLTGFYVVLEITGESSYSIVDGVNPTQVGLGAGTYEVGPFPNGSYNVTVTNEANSFCYQNINGSKFCELPVECDLDVNITTECIDGDVFQMTITLEGGSTYNVFSGFFGEVLLNVPAGTHVVEDFFFDNFYNLFIQDQENLNCTVNISGTSTCVDDCDLIVNVDTECNEDGGYNLIVTVEGSGTYDIDVNDAFITFDGLDDVPAGVYTFENLETDIYNVNVVGDGGGFSDPFGPPGGGCAQFINGTPDCPTSYECDLGVGLSTNCLSDNEFEIIVEITGSSIYTINDDFGDQISDIGAGTYVLGPYPNGEYFISVNEGNGFFFECSNGSFIANDCTEDCDLSVGYETICIDNANYILEITVEGSGTYNIYSDFFGTTYENVPSGTYEVGPYPEDFFFYFVQVEDANTGGCYRDFFGNTECTFDPQCDLDASISPECNVEGTEFSITLSISGSEAYDVSLADELLFEEVGEGDYLIEGLSNGNYNIELENTSNNTCIQSFNGSFFCEPPPSCDLNVLSETVCNDDDSGFVIQLTIEGTSTYSAFIGGDEALSAVEAGVYQVGNYGNNESYQVTIVDQENDQCTQSFSGVFACDVPVVCDLTTTVATECVDQEGNYILVVTIQGSSTYNIFSNFDEEFEVGSGTYEFGPYNTDEYEVNVEDISDFGCFQFYNGPINCQNPPPLCDVGVDIVSVDCIDDDNYTVTVNINGSSTYDVHEGLYVQWPGGTPLLAGEQASGPLTVGPFDNGNFDLLFVDTENPECYVDFIGNKNCNNPDACNILASIDTQCNDDGTYNVIIYLNGGDDLYEIRVWDGGVGANLIYDEDDQPLGVYNIGPITTDTYYVFIQHEDIPPCDQDFLGTNTCTGGEQVNCDLVVTTSVDCINDGSGAFNIVLDIEGSDTYTIQSDFFDDLEGQPAGEVVIGPFPGFFFDFYYAFVESEQTQNCYANVQGVVNCFAPPSCDLVTDLELECISGSSYNLIVTIEGADTYTVTTDIGVFTDVEPGTYTYGPMNLNTYDLEIESNQTPNCFNTYNATESCEDPGEPTCDIDIEATASCINETEFQLEVTLTGTGPFTIDDGIVITTGLDAGVYIRGPFPNGNYSVTASSETLVNCDQTVVGIKDCTIPFVCDLQANVVDRVCIDENNYQLVINITGASSYTLDDGINTPKTNITTGTVIMGPIPNGNYEISVTDEASNDCFQTLAGVYNCLEPEECDLGVVAEANCIEGTNTYQISINLSGSSLYTIVDGVNDPLFGQTAGSIVLGPYNSGDYDITIVDENNNNCAIPVTGTQECVIVPGCDLSVTNSTACVGAGTFQITLTLSGTSLYTINDGVNAPITGQPASTFSLPPLASGSYNIFVFDENNVDCNLNLPISEDCPVENTVIGQLVFNDLDQDGIQDFNEPGMPDITVTLYNGSGIPVETTTTDTNGNYLFDNIPEGEYYIVVGIPPGFDASPKDQGNDDEIDSDIDQVGSSEMFNLPDGALNLDIDAGIFIDPLCENFAATAESLCPVTGDQFGFYLAVAISGGAEPYVLDLSNVTTLTLTQTDFPLDKIGPLDFDSTYELTITDANDCPIFFEVKAPLCGTVDVEWLSFDGEVMTEGNMLKWTTASENNNDFFTLYRSQDGTSFDEVTEVEGAGTSSILNSYNFLDKEAPIGLSYYYLSQTDFDGSQTYSNVITLFRGESVSGNLAINVYPVPTSTTLQLDITAASNEKVQVKIFDILGRLIDSFQDVRANEVQTIDVSAYAAGTYLISVDGASQNATQKFTKQ